ncbi:MAG: ABC transporter ATP-binding protein [Propionicimonas sp.]
MNWAIKAEGLTYGVDVASDRRLEILRGASVAVRPQESVAVVGRSGSGKTSLLMLLGLLGSPDGGSLVMGGRDVTRLGESRAAAVRNELIGYVFQDFALIDSLDVLENVLVPFVYGRRHPAKAARSQAEALLEVVGLDGFQHRKVSQLSGGEKQRVAIARALVRRPPVILADEPTGSLDLDSGAEVMAALRAAASTQESCLVVVTHDRVVARAMDTRLELRDGVLVPLADEAE